MIHGYSIQYRVIPEPKVINDINNVKPAQENVTVVNVDAKQVIYDLEGLTTGAIYSVVVYANTSDGMGPGSSPVFIKVEKDAIGTTQLGMCDTGHPSCTKYKNR